MEEPLLNCLMEVVHCSPLSGQELAYPGGCEHLPTHENIHFPCVQNFVEAVLDGAPLVSSADSAIWTDWVTEAAVRQNGNSRV